MRERLVSIPGITGLVAALIGLVLAIGGIDLLRLGGSLYYLLAGLGLIASGALIILRRRLGFWIYATVLLLTLLWSLVEVGLDGWALVPRLVAPAVLGLWISLPWVAGRLDIPADDAIRWKKTRWLASGACVLLIVAVLAAGWGMTAARWTRDGAVAAALPVPPASPALADGDWQWYGRTADGDRYSPLAQITPDNVRKLQVAWTFRTGDMPSTGENSHGREFNFEATPIKVGDSVYLCTPHRDVVALDPVTGKQRWRFHPQNDTSHNIYLACRGVAYYRSTQAADPCPERIILSGWVYDNQTEGEPSGVIRAFDARSGQLSWAWDMGRANPTSPLKPGEVFTRGTPNGWGAYTADDKLGLVYVPMGNATPDYWGAKRRPFDETYGAAIVALDIDSGKERWHFQTVHHDVWDFDLPIAGSLVDLPGGVPALVQTTKRGEIFLLDRRSGRPLADIVEKPAPQKPLPGDHLSPTQPYSTGMPSLAPADLTERDMWGATPIDQMLCRIQFRKLRYDGQFTPPSTQGSIAYPAFDGVMDWQGGTIDPTRHLFIANTSYIPFTVTAMPTAEAMKKGLMKPWAGWASGQPYPKPKEFADGPEYGTPYEVTVKPWLNALGAPCIRPPWGKMVAIDLVTRKIVWERPVGTTRDMGLFKTHLDVPLPTGIFNIGGSVVTGSGLIFVGAYADDYIRAIDERTGRIIWQARLSAGGQATPSTYRGRDGRQYVVISAGGHGGLGTRNGDYVVAYALPPA
ncbi:outer membrane protein assembly factor BamB family protein [Sphingomonas oryzagri]